MRVLFLTWKRIRVLVVTGPRILTYKISFSNSDWWLIIFVLSTTNSNLDTTYCTTRPLINSLCLWKWVLHYPPYITAVTTTQTEEISNIGNCRFDEFISRRILILKERCSAYRKDERWLQCWASTNSRLVGNYWMWFECFTYKRRLVRSFSTIKTTDGWRQSKLSYSAHDHSKLFL